MHSVKSAAVHNSIRFTKTTWQNTVSCLSQNILRNSALANVELLSVSTMANFLKHSEWLTHRCRCLTLKNKCISPTVSTFLNFFENRINFMYLEATCVYFPLNFYQDELNCCTITRVWHLPPAPPSSTVFRGRSVGPNELLGWSLVPLPALSYILASISALSCVIFLL